MDQSRLGVRELRGDLAAHIRRAASGHHLVVTVGGRPFTILEPERRLFTVQRRQVAETAIHSNGLRDLYAALGEGDRNTGWVVRLYLNPLAPWIWLGAALCAFGGFVSLSDRRLRVGAPSRRPAVQAAE